MPRKAKKSFRGSARKNTRKAARLKRPAKRARVAARSAKPKKRIVSSRRPNVPKVTTISESRKNTETGCCPRFDPAPWDGKVFKWDKKKFVKGRVLTLFNIPINFGPVIVGMMKKMEAAGAKSAGWMGLSDHTSFFNMDIYVAVDRNVPGLENTTLSGKFLMKAYEGPFRDTGKWCKDFSAFAERKKMKVKKMYMWYTTCPKCAKVYGKNYVVIVGQV